ncbi:hypothetical protein GIB67_018480 [Kingdonia uniflora]|uniref:Uncharacterized protein n=1 Tax=Kingdonia uniflora TaxID=39325 RepID=A0A7J7LW55_9MAGN|nr:hypothetical protein GIB67_018480 [Kingdonia uniflora]
MAPKVWGGTKRPRSDDTRIHDGQRVYWATDKGFRDRPIVKEKIVDIKSIFELKTLTNEDYWTKVVLDSEDNMHDANDMDSLDDDEHNSRDDYDVKDDIVEISSKQQAREVPSSPTAFATSNYNMDMRHIQLHYGYASHFSLCMGPSKVDYDDQTPKDLIRLRCYDSRNS